MKAFKKIALWTVGLIVLLLAYGWLDSKPEATRITVVGFLIFGYCYFELTKAMERHQKSLHERLDIIERKLRDLTDSPLNSAFISEGLGEFIRDRDEAKRQWDDEALLGKIDAVIGDIK
ncbi:hypothetical protein PMI15_04059 [Polaromonas sp. CF318]|uniref:hypothetical protein n=1 Tax=Polaromonas sp. CF318 TaxID=1144318 RepID=UPI0002713D74|nr:hypothetical protein [Polaromonas sp. CF318]EJL79071.1 hypothetical protein PMI15_04059 [Polaromonas sp. CF318]